MKKSHDPVGKNTRWLCVYAGRLVAVGHLGIAFCLCLLWILLDSSMRGEALLYAETYIRSVGGFGVFLWGTALGMDWLERFYFLK